MGRVRYAGARQLTVRADSGFYTHGRRLPPDDRFSITIRQSASLRRLIEAIPEQDWTPIPYWIDGAADVAKPATLPSRASPTPRRCGSSSGACSPRVPSWPSSIQLHGCITDREGETLALEADHRRHAEMRTPSETSSTAGVEPSPLGPLPRQRRLAGGASDPHNLARWTARIGLGEQIVTTKTLRRRFFSMAGRLTRSAWSLCICPKAQFMASLIPSAASFGARPPLTRWPTERARKLAPSVREHLLLRLVPNLARNNHCRPTSSPPQTVQTAANPPSTRIRARAMRL